MQTAAIDIWSLGAVALALLLGHSDWADELPLHEQGSSTKYILQQLRSVQDFTSKGQDFITSCMKLQSVERVSAEEADRHPWLTSPESHLQFFNSLDKRMLETWTSQSHIRPLPMQLTDSQVKRVTTKEKENPVGHVLEDSIQPRADTLGMAPLPPPEAPMLGLGQPLQELQLALLNKGKRKHSGAAQQHHGIRVSSDVLLRKAPIRVALCVDDRPGKRPTGTRRRILHLSSG